jgi:hypothetical protein
MSIVKNLVGISILLLLFACSSKDRVEGDLYFKTNFEDIQPFHESNQYVKTESHSGMFCGKVDSTNVYGIAFKAKLSDVLYKRVRKVKVAAWCKYLNGNSSGKLVVAFLNGQEQVGWSGFEISDEVKRLNEWIKVSGEFEIDKNAKITPETLMYVYVWNTSKQEFYYDDLEVSFDE